MALKDYLELIAIGLFVILGGFCMGWFRILKETNSLLKEQNEELKNDNKEWRDKHIENERAIAELRGEIKNLKTIPLNDISEHMREQTRFMKELFKFMKAHVEEK